MADTSRETVEALASRIVQSHKMGLIGLDQMQDAAATLRALLDERDRLREALQYINNMGQSAEPDHWNFRVHARNRAAAALKEPTDE